MRAFGNLTERWESSEDDTPKRDLHSRLSIAEIVSRFDVVAIQRAGDNLNAPRHLLEVLGTDWSLSLTDVTEGARQRRAHGIAVRHEEGGALRARLRDRRARKAAIVRVKPITLGPDTNPRGGFSARET